MNNLIFIDEKNEIINDYEKYSENNLDLNEKNVVNKILDVFYISSKKEKEYLENKIEIKFSKSKNFKQSNNILTRIENLFGELLISISIYDTTPFIYKYYSSKIIKEIEEYQQLKNIERKIYAGDILAICFPYHNEIKDNDSVYKMMRDQIKDLDEKIVINHFYTNLIHFDSSTIGFAFEQLFMENLLFYNFYNYQSMENFNKFVEAKVTNKEKDLVRLKYNKVLYQDKNFIIKMDEE